MTQVLRQIFLDETKLKVFFDGRKDVEALHFQMGIGVRGYVDL